ncbi:MAG TPA: hypothetical protein VFS76_08120 [Pyrinomonadaceae bacterium]|nr:hypothetical protein [Pyrinomonadaceae bacterium]
MFISLSRDFPEDFWGITRNAESWGELDHPVAEKSAEVEWESEVRIASPMASSARKKPSRLTGAPRRFSLPPGFINIDKFGVIILSFSP